MKFSFCYSSNLCGAMGIAPQPFPPPRDRAGDIKKLSSKRMHLIWQVDILEVSVQGQVFHFVFYMESRTGHIMMMMPNLANPMSLQRFNTFLYEQWCLLTVELGEEILGLQAQELNLFKDILSESMSGWSRTGRVDIQGWRYNDEKLLSRIQSFKPFLTEVMQSHVEAGTTLNDIAPVLDMFIKKENYMFQTTRLLYTKALHKTAAVLNMAIDGNFRVLDMMGVSEVKRQKVLDKFEHDAITGVFTRQAEAENNV